MNRSYILRGKDIVAAVAAAAAGRQGDVAIATARSYQSLVLLLVAPLPVTGLGGKDWASGRRGRYFCSEDVYCSSRALAPAVLCILM